MKSVPTVGVVIRTRNRPILLPRALHSVAAQTYPEWYVVVVNDGGESESVEKNVNQLPQPIQARIKVIHLDPGQGMQNAANRGAEALQTDYIILHDDDDTWHPEFLSVTVEYLENPPHPSIRGVITHTIAIYEEQEYTSFKETKRDYFNLWIEEITLFKILKHNFFPPISFLMKRAAWEEAGPYDEIWGPLGDWEFNIRFLRTSNIGLIKNALANYHLRPEQSNSYGNTWYGNKEYSISHKFYSTLLRNHWQKQGYLGNAYIGISSAMSEAIHDIEDKIVSKYGTIADEINNKSNHTTECNKRFDVIFPFKNVGVVGIVLRTKDRPILLRRALQDICKQSFSEWNLVIVNDGGDFTLTQKIFNEFSHHLNDRACLIHNPTSQGIESASNQAIRKLNTRYIAIHDDDDTWAPEFLQETVNYLMQTDDPSVKGVVTKTELIIETLHDSSYTDIHREEFNPSVKDIKLSSLLEENLFPPISFVYDRSVFATLGAYREDLPVLGDWEFNVRFVNHYNIGLIPKTLAYYHQRPDEVTSSYGNTVRRDDRLHRTYESILHEEWKGNAADKLSNSKYGINGAQRQLINLSNKLGFIEELIKSKGELLEKDTKTLIHQILESPSFKLRSYSVVIPLDDIKKEIEFQKSQLNDLSIQIKALEGRLADHNSVAEKQNNEITEQISELRMFIQEKLRPLETLQALEKQNVNIQNDISDNQHLLKQALAQIEGVINLLNAKFHVLHSDVIEQLWSVKRKLERKIRKKKFWHLFFNGP